MTPERSPHLMQSAIDTLREQELKQKENLIGVLSVVTGSRASSTATSGLQSVTRGLCTYNQKLLASIKHCMFDAESQGVEAYKNLVNDFIMWFDGCSVIFERYLHCLPLEKLVADSTLQKPLEHYANYITFIDVSLRSFRNPLVVERLDGARDKIEMLLATKRILEHKSRLNDISFDRVKGFGGLTVSCSFSVDQIVERTEDIRFYIGNDKVELVLLNLDKDGAKITLCNFNALAILRISELKGSRAVIYPPFRINDLSMSLSSNCINFSSVSYSADSDGTRFALTGDDSTIQEWYKKLKHLFPVADKVLSSESIALEGLCINTSLESFCRDSAFNHKDYQSISPSLLHSRRVRQNSSVNVAIYSSRVYADRASSYLMGENSSPSHQSLEKNLFSDSDDFSINSDGFELVSKPQKVFGNANAAQSLPDFAQSKPMFQNAASSAIDISDFGKSHKPTFTPEVREEKYRRTIFGIFRKTPKNDVLGEMLDKNKAVVESKKVRGKGKKEAKQKNDQEKAAKNERKNVTKRTKAEKTEKTPNLKKLKEKQQVRPDLSISIPKAFDAPNGTLATLKSSQFSPGSTVPLPFALPSSTSPCFFKHYLSEAGLADANGHMASFGPSETILEIPQFLKDEINSDDSLDFYISPSSTRTLKVSKWKPRAGKWEMLTSSDDVFVKIVVNYILDKRWLLVFKEDTIDGEDVDVPLLIMDLNNQSKFRRSSASDVELGAVNTITNEKMLIIVRCYKGEVFDAFYNSLSSNFESMKSPSLLQKSSNYGSSGTLTSSLMSRPSTSSTLTSLFTARDQQAGSESENIESRSSCVERVLLDRMTVKVHKQMESYDQIHLLSTWKAISMYSLSLFHSIDELGTSFYHFELKDKRSDDESDEFEWSFTADALKKDVERIGKAGLLVMCSADEIYMLECRGRKELERLFSTFC